MWKILPFFVALFVVGLGASPPGDLQDMDVRDPGFQRALYCALADYNRNSEDEHIYAVEVVLQAQSQVVEGVNYIMTLKLGKTFCTKEFPRRLCPIIRNPHNASFIFCSFTVLDAPRLGGMRLTDSECQERNPWDEHLLQNNLEPVKKS